MKAHDIIKATCFALLFAALHAQAQQTVYKWVDKDGKTQFSDSPPPADAKNSTASRMGGGYVDEGQMPYATRMAAQKSPVVLYAAPECTDLCTQGRQLLGRRGIPFTEKNVKDKAVEAEVKALIGTNEIPVLRVGETTLKGFSDEAWTVTLDQAGYAKGRLPGQPGYQPQ